MGGINMAFIKLVSKEGLPFLINKYFLQLYDEFYHSLIVDHLNDDITIIFTRETKASIEVLVNNVNNKHLNCENSFKKECTNLDKTNNEYAYEASLSNQKITTPDDYNERNESTMKLPLNQNVSPSCQEKLEVQTLQYVNEELHKADDKNEKNESNMELSLDQNVLLSNQEKEENQTLLCPFE